MSDPSRASSGSVPVASTTPSSLKWLSKLRTLPSNPNSNDFLKLEYIDVNLNNSRKLISNLGELTTTSLSLIDEVDTLNGSLIQLNQVKKELEWLE